MPPCQAADDTGRGRHDQDRERSAAERFAAHAPYARDGDDGQNAAHQNAVADRLRLTTTANVALLNVPVVMARR